MRRNVGRSAPGGKTSWPILAEQGCLPSERELPSRSVHSQCPVTGRIFDRRSEKQCGSDRSGIQARPYSSLFPIWERTSCAGPMQMPRCPRFVPEGAFFRRQKRKASSEVEAWKAIAALPQKLPSRNQRTQFFSTLRSRKARYGHVNRWQHKSCGQDG